MITWYYLYDFARRVDTVVEIARREGYRYNSASLYEIVIRFYRQSARFVASVIQSLEPCNHRFVTDDFKIEFKLSDWIIYWGGGINFNLDIGQ